MKLVSFGPHGEERPGVLTDNGIVDVCAMDSTVGASVRAILERDELDRIGDLAAQPDATTAPLDTVRLGPPVTDPTKIICVGLNYRDHAAEQGKTLPGYPLLFSKGPNVLCGHGDNVPYPRVVTQFDFEVELAFVVGRRAKHVELADAMSYVAGYGVFLDLTARDLQHNERQWFRAKSVDGSGPFGPWLVTRDEIPEPHALDIKLDISGETLQESNTREMEFTVDFLVHHISQTMTLEPGDIVATGTPPGVGAHRDPQRFLNRGDRLDASVTGLGTLTCHIA